MQPVYKDSDGTVRFKENALVKYLYEWAKNKGCSMNDLMLIPASKEDRQQLAQLIGYTLSGYSELPYVDDAAYAKAHRKRGKL
jgi:putative N-acetylmannosamine-6-phosphate epimerase